MASRIKEAVAAASAEGAKKLKAANARLTAWRQNKTARKWIGRGEAGAGGILGGVVHAKMGGIEIGEDGDPDQFTVPYALAAGVAGIFAADASESDDVEDVSRGLLAYGLGRLVEDILE